MGQFGVYDVHLSPTASAGQQVNCTLTTAKEPVDVYMRIVLS